MKTDRLQIRMDYIEERDKPYRNETEGKINYTEDYVKWLEDKVVNNINYKHCSELLTDIDKEELIDNSYWLNLQNLSVREPFDKAFKLGIEVGIEEMTEYLQNKEIV